MSGVRPALLDEKALRLPEAGAGTEPLQPVPHHLAASLVPLQAEGALLEEARLPLQHAGGEFLDLPPQVLGSIAGQGGRAGERGDRGGLLPDVLGDRLLAFAEEFDDLGPADDGLRGGRGFPFADGAEGGEGPEQSGPALSWTLDPHGAQPLLQ